ncbi:hypothetical protein ACQP60_17415 [Isoptericola variabilis]|uniref:hypothetical protein n=1 Tax=Isoptericola variabilis TaxID=139208 RepID=UPI003D1A3DC3
MLQRILGGVLVLVGLVAAALGVASATVWRDTDTVVATAKPTGDGTLVVTDPGVLGLVGGDVTVSASVPEGQKVTLAVGRDVDVAGWVGNDPYSRVTGLSDWENLSVAEGEPADPDAEEKPETGADPAGSDMWVAEATDENSVTLRWSDRPGRWTLLAAGVGDDATAPTLELSWPRAVTTPWLWPGVGVGAVLVLGGALLLVLGGRRARARRADLAEQESRDGDGTDLHDDGPSAGGLGAPFAPVRPGADDEPAAWPPSPTTDAAQETPDSTEEPSGEGETPDDGAARDEAAGTAEVPLAGRLLRRSRRRQREEPVDAPSEASPAAAPAATGTTPEPAPFGGLPVPAPAVPAEPTAHQPVPAEPAVHEPVPAEPPTATGALRMTRRELRAQEEARRAAEQGGMTRMLRAITGSIPAVRPAQTEQASEQAAARPDTSTPSGRAAAWRATWGFGDASRTGQAADPTTENDGENR